MGAQDVTIQPGWQVRGVWYEACASEGHCPLYFGRDMESPCRNFAVYDIREGQINGVDMAGVRIISVADILSTRAAELPVSGTAAAIYVSENATAEQRPILEAFVATSLPLPVRELRGVKFVPIDISLDGPSYHITMPFGELKGSLTVGRDRTNPQRIENLAVPFLRDLKIANTELWRYNDLGRNWEYRNRSGTVGDLAWPP
ncbi:MAG: DUF1326 domain-containing protein [Dehalococcoidia bacterium]